MDKFSARTFVFPMILVGLIGLVRLLRSPRSFQVQRTRTEIPPVRDDLPQAKTGDLALTRPESTDTPADAVRFGGLPTSQGYVNGGFRIVLAPLLPGSVNSD